MILQVRKMRFSAAAFFNLVPVICGLRFMPNTFSDVSEECTREGKVGRFLDIANPALYIRLDAQATPGRRKLGLNKTIDCEIEIQTVRPPDNDKEMLEMDALSLIILELNYSRPHDSKSDDVKVVTSSYFGQRTTVVTQESNYGTNRVWTNNPTFLLSGQLTGFDPIDTRHRTRHYIHETHVYPPDRIISTFDNPASIQVKMKNWNLQSKIYLIFTSYKLLAAGQSCRDGAEYECPTDEKFQQTNGKLCMSLSLACDGLPNCGENTIPNPDEACFKIHWSSVLLSLVSYILLAITLLLCMSCFARILIQWSVRSSLEEMRSTSIRSSSRFFSLFGGSFSRHWERPPPTYDESLKHVNPDLQQRPPDPPPYSESFRARFPLSRSLLALRNSSSAGSSTPPPDYTSTEDVRTRQANSGINLSLNPQGQVTTSAALTQSESSPGMARVLGDARDGRDLVSVIPEESHSLCGDDPQTGGGAGLGGDGAAGTAGVPLLGHRDSLSSSLASRDSIKRNRDFNNTDEISDFPSPVSKQSKQIVVRTSQSGLIPDTPGPHPEISGLIPDNSEIDPNFQNLFTKSQNRTSKSGLLAQNRTSRSGLYEDIPPLKRGPEALNKEKPGTSSEIMN